MVGAGRLPSVWIWRPHLVAFLAIAIIGAAYVACLRRGSSSKPAVSTRQRAAFAWGLALLGLVLCWPIADLADRSLLVRMAQQTALLLGVPALVLTGLPRWLVDAATRPAALDALARCATRPVTAGIVFNAIAVTVFVPGVMNASVRSPSTEVGVDVLLVVAGTLMWAPVLRVVPGVGHLRPAGRAGYLMVQSVVPSIASLVFIFARHPIYSAYDPGSIGLTPLVDQQLAGALAKVVSLGVLLGAAGFILVRSHHTEEAGGDPDPLTWDDVERELRRIDRRRRPVTDGGSAAAADGSRRWRGPRTRRA